MVELRKRKPAQEPAAAPPPAKKKSSNPIKNAVDKAKQAVLGGSGGDNNGSNGTNGTTASNGGKAIVGDTIPIDSFGGEVETMDGEKTTLGKLIQSSESGVVIFTYPKASTPGCTTQACLFRDAYSHLTSTGLSIYGLSCDSPKSNTTFKTKQTLPYTLLSDPTSSLISALGYKKGPKQTTRGVIVIDKSGKVLASEAGGPQATVDVVADLIKEGKVGDKKDPAAAQGASTTAAEAPMEEKADQDLVGAATGTNTLEEPPKLDEAPLVKEPSKEEADAATTAADVADTAAKIDGEPNVVA